MSSASPRRKSVSLSASGEAAESSSSPSGRRKSFVSFRRQSTAAGKGGETSQCRVLVRIRPFLETERNEEDGLFPAPPVAFDAEEPDKCIYIDQSTMQEKEVFSFDRCLCSIHEEQWEDVLMQPRFALAPLPPFSSQQDVYDYCGTPVLDSMLEGFNASILAYGQTSSGKTFTMVGTPKNEGVIPRLLRGILASIETQGKKKAVRRSLQEFSLEAGFFEIYNENVLDLFCKVPPSSPAMESGFKHRKRRVRNHPTFGVFVEDLNYERIESLGQAMKLLSKGLSLRHTSATKLNVQSSRSHAIFQLRFTSTTITEGGTTQQRSNVHLADLAGCERLKQSMSEGDRLREAAQINQSLTTLRKVIDALTGGSSGSPSRFVPYRESMLTWVLSESLGGNAKSFLIATLCPHPMFAEETYNTLQYATKAKSIVNTVSRNEDAIGKLIRELQETVSKQQHGEEVGAEVEEELQLRQQTIDELIAKQEDMQRGFLELQSTLQQQTDQQEMLTESVVSLSAKSMVQSQENAALLNELDRLEQDNAELQQQLIAVRKENIQIHQKNEMLTKQVSEFMEKIGAWVSGTSDPLLQYSTQLFGTTTGYALLAMAQERRSQELRDMAAREVHDVRQRCAEAEARSSQLEDVNMQYNRALDEIAEKYVKVKQFLWRAEGGVLEKQWTVASIIHSLNDFCKTYEQIEALSFRHVEEGILPSPARIHRDQATDPIHERLYRRSIGNTRKAAQQYSTSPRPNPQTSGIGSLSPSTNSRVPTTDVHRRRQVDDGGTGIAASHHHIDPLATTTCSSIGSGYSTQELLLHHFSTAKR